MRIPLGDAPRPPKDAELADRLRQAVEEGKRLRDERDAALAGWRALWEVTPPVRRARDARGMAPPEP